jgi:U4/U6 small nuclear ribonucleoprotein PRP4
MRSLRALYTIPAHKSNVSDVRFFRGTELPIHLQKDVEMADASDSNTPAPNGGDGGESTADVSTDKEDEQEAKYRSGLYFASAGYDGLVKLWSADDWQLLRTLSTDAGKVMSVDLSSNGKFIASGTWNRNYQLYTPEDV